ncbi:MAG: DUF2484 family protein [Dinoroseobacter sp.]|nr:DUF2484 family protein [Dinoroseobacter sp.]
MPASLILACLWFVIAILIAFLPSKKQHWPQAYALMAVGAPILIWVFVQTGPWMGLVVLAGAMSILRWPVIYLGRWLHRRVVRPD